MGVENNQYIVKRTSDGVEAEEVQKLTGDLGHKPENLLLVEDVVDKAQLDELLAAESEAKVTEIRSKLEAAGFKVSDVPAARLPGQKAGGWVDQKDDYTLPRL